MAATGILLPTLIWSCLLFSVHGDTDDDSFPRIGIVGAGVGGTSTAYFLHELFGDKVQIDIFEADQVGGRAAVAEVGEHKYEAGASIIHVKNRYMVHFNNLYRKDGSSIPRGGGKIGLYGSDGMVFEGSDWTAVTLAKLFWRYGFSLYTLQTWIKNTVLPQFERIYAYQDKGMAFTTCEDLLRAMGDDLFNMTQHSMEQILVDAGISQMLVQELGMAAMRTNYGQTTDVHGLVGAVSLIGTESGLWSVIGGNKNIPEFLLQESKASLIMGSVTSVALVKGDQTTYELDYIKLDPEGLGQTGTREYDLVVVATPILGTKNKIAFLDFPSSIPNFSQNFHNTVAMFVQGHINKTTFHLEKDSQFPADLFTITKDLFFNSIGKQTPVDTKENTDNSAAKENVWKTFLNHVPMDEQVNELFESKSDMKIVDWLAYPEYQPKMDLPPFVLNENLYYVNAIESAASALEMSAIGAKNVALLVYNHWYNHLDRIDENNMEHQTDNKESKAEL